jgi:hypothetical protein
MRTQRVQYVHLFEVCLLRLDAPLNASALSTDGGFLRTEIKIRRQNRYHEPHSNGDIYYLWYPWNFICISGTLDPKLRNSSSLV